MTDYYSDYFSIQIDNDIVYVIWQKEWVDYKAIDYLIKSRLAITGERSYPMFSDITRLKGGTRDAMIRLAAKDGLTGLKALAVLYDKKLHIVLYRLFNIFSNNTVPTKFFRCNSKAFLWLENYK